MNNLRFKGVYAYLFFYHVEKNLGLMVQLLRMLSDFLSKAVLF